MSLQNAPKNWLTDVAFLSQLDGGCLRSSSLPRRFLKTAGIHFDGCRLKQAMELRTINKNLEQIRSLCEEPLRPVIDKFFDKRLADNRSGQMKLLTIRLETSSVTALLEYAQEVGSITAALDVLAVEVPGLKASLSAFLNYLNQYAGSPYNSSNESGNASSSSDKITPTKIIFRKAAKRVSRFVFGAATRCPSHQYKATCIQKIRAKLHRYP